MLRLPTKYGMGLCRIRYEMGWIAGAPALHLDRYFFTRNCPRCLYHFQH